MFHKLEATLRSISIALIWLTIFGLATQALAADPPLRIGVLEDMSGPLADLSGPGSVMAARMAAEDLGTVLGRKVEIVSADHQNKADIGAQIAKQWIDLDGVEMVTGLGNTAIGLAVRSVARERGKIDIVTSGGSSDFTGKDCTPTSFHWVYDTYSLAKTIGTATVRSGDDTFFMVSSAYTFGIVMSREGTRFATAAGGKSLGEVRVALDTPDLSSFILQAQASRAKVIMLGIAGADLNNFIKQAAEFRISEGGQKLAAFVAFVNDIHSLGLETTKGMLVAEAFYWDLNDDTRAFSKRFYEALHKMPNSMQAGAYSAVKHYLTAVQAAGTTDSAVVAAKMRELPVNDFMTTNGHIREDGRLLRDFYLFEAKMPAESRGDWDLLKPLEKLSGEEAFRPLSESECPLVKK
jgi:branched-chain amino acid transport system substrate-binding protein